MNSVTDVLISAKVTAKKIKTHLKYVLPFSAMDEAPAYVTGHLIWQKYTKDSRSTCNEQNAKFLTSEKLTELIWYFSSFHTNIIAWNSLIAFYSKFIFKTMRFQQN